MRNASAWICAALLATWTVPQAMAQDTLKLAIGQRGNWDTAVSHVGEKAGIFKKHSIVLDMTYTSGSGETLQPVISNSVDIGLAIGTLGAIAAYAKGAPVRVIGAEATGAADYWYAKSDSGIKTLDDIIAQADVALYEAKSQGRDVVKISTESFESASTGVRRALRRSGRPSSSAAGLG